MARQLRLRDLGGIIVVDFIDLLEEPHRDKVLHELESALVRDRARTTVIGMSEFGLVQITRQRQKKSLARVLLEACPHCAGSGRVRSAETVALAALRKVRAAEAADPVSALALEVRVHPADADVLRGVLARPETARTLGVRVDVIDDARLARDAFDIVRGVL